MGNTTWMKDFSYGKNSSSRIVKGSPLTEAELRKQEMRDQWLLNSLYLKKGHKAW